MLKIGYLWIVVQIHIRIGFIYPTRASLLSTMVTDILPHPTYNSKGAWHTVYAILFLNDKTEILKKFIHLKNVIFFQIHS